MTSNIPEKARLLLRLPNWVGDIVMATPCLEALKRERPDVRISLAVRVHLVPLLEGYPGIEEIIPIRGKSFPAMLEYLKAVRKRRFSAAVVFSKGFRDGIVAGLSGIPQRAGFAVNSRGIFFNSSVKMTDELWNGHHALQFAELMKPLGITEGESVPFLPVSGGRIEQAKEMIAASGLEEKKFAVFHIGASKFPRAYHADRFAWAARTVKEKTGLNIVIIGTEEDKPYIEKFGRANPDFADLSGKIPLGTLPALLSFAKVFVGSDSGPMHIASAVGTPVVAVFGPGSPLKTAPLLPDDKKRIVYTGLPCSPCRQSFFKDCEPSAEGKPPCLQLLSQETLAGRIIDLLETI